jgi:hypothetical protein
LDLSKALKYMGKNRRFLPVWELCRII